MPPRLPPIGRVARAALTRRVPVYAHWGITHRCNLTCKMCGIWRYGDKAEELSLAQVEVLADRLKRMGVIQLALGGGEPFVRDDLEELVGILIDRGLEVRVLTNGVDIPTARIERLVERGLRSFAVSLDSLYPARFDYICEREGAWEEVVRSLTVMAAALEGKRGNPAINCVVSHLNLDELQEMVWFAKALGFAISFLPVELLEEPRGSGKTWEDRFIRFRPEMKIPRDQQAAGRVGERVRKAYDRLIELKAQGYPILNSTPYLQASRHYLETGRFPAQACDAGRLYFSIAPNGDYTICHRTQHQHRSILDPDFERYFQSDEYERLRRHEVASCEGCMRACWIDTSFMFRTIQGLTETTKLFLSRPTGTPLSWEQARTWARYDLDAVIPGPTTDGA
jgi:MoaA/NifB/PqqE/SkfB family radical SAM enzyme